MADPELADFPIIRHSFLTYSIHIKKIIQKREAQHLSFFMHFISGTKYFGNTIK
jgi:hypothetical protein